MPEIESENLKRGVKPLDLALSASRKRVSSKTKLVHLLPGQGKCLEVVPIYENFCYALALLKQKSVDEIKEGRSLLSRLFGFQAPSKNFPAFLHDFPNCWDKTLPLKIASVLFLLLKNFRSALGIDLQEKSDLIFSELVGLSLKINETSPYPPLWKERLSSLLKKIPLTDPVPIPENAKECFEWVLTREIANEKKAYEIPYSKTLQLYLNGPFVFDQGEPVVQTIEWLLAKDLASHPRLLNDHPNQIYLSLLDSVETLSENGEDSIEATPLSPYFFWKGKEKIHSLAMPSGKWAGSNWIVEIQGLFASDREDAFEVPFFLNLSEETSIFVEGVKATVFHLGEKVTLQTGSKAIELRFSLLEGTGDFIGHISKSNRPLEIREDEATDWQIALRSLRRSDHCRIQVAVEFRR